MHVTLRPYRLRLSALVIASVACSPAGRHAPPPPSVLQAAPPPSAGCRAGAPAGARSFESGDTTAVMRLAGAYAATVVTTEGLPAEPRRASLRLHPTDSAEASYQPAVGPGRRLAQPLSAVLSWETDAEGGTPVEILLRLRRATLVRDDGRHCFHCAMMHYRIEWVSDAGFGGSWSTAFDNLLAQGSDGRWHSGAAGHFCAWRPAGER